MIPASVPILRERTSVLSERTRRRARRGVTALTAMLFLVLLTTLSLGLYATATRNVQTSANYSYVATAQGAAESGLRWMDYRFQKMNRPKTLSGSVTTTVADTLWPNLRSAIAADLESVAGTVAGKGVAVTVGTDTITTTPIPVDNSGATFTVKVRRLTAADGAGIDGRFVRVICTGNYRNTTRSVSMDFQMDKKAKFAVVGRVPLQLGRNTLLEGPVGMGTAAKLPPVLMLSDFTHFDSALKTRVEGFQSYLKGTGVVNGKSIKNHDGYDNRISVNNADELKLATAAGYSDYNGDAFIDEYDLFLQRFDTDGDRALTKAEFTNVSTGKLYDQNLFDAIDQLAAPLRQEDRNGNGILDPGEDANGNGILDQDPPRSGYKDGVIDNRDGYAKAKGQVQLSVSASAWAADLASQGKKISDMMPGPIASTSPTEPAVKFGAAVMDLSPANFEQCSIGFKNKSGAAGGALTKTAALIANTTLAATDANGGTSTERTPYGSVTYQATYARPVFKNLTLRNVIVPKGLNALFDNCVFEGVTYVDMTRNITNSAGATTTNKDDGMTWAKRMKPTFTFAAGTALTATNSLGFTDGNNLRFNNCVFNGPLASGYATAYSHFSNTWEFTGSTQFDNKVDQTATIVAPQTNIEMGSFTTPTQAQSRLVGVVVAGNIDIRGTTTIDGSIIVTGDGAGNTTLGYFGNNDGDTNPTAMPEGGFGRLNMRYNPYRTLPDGINIAIDLAPRVSSYREGYSN